MTKLKVTEVEKVVDVKKDEVVAGQLRMSKGDGILSMDTVIIVLDARGTVAEGTEDNPFVPAILNGFNEFRVGVRHNAVSAEQVAEEFPILLDAELTYSEAK